MNKHNQDPSKTSVGVGTADVGRVESFAVPSQIVNGHLELSASGIYDYLTFIKSKFASKADPTLYIPLSDLSAGVAFVEPQPIIFHDDLVTLRPDSRAVYVNNTEVELTTQEFDLLHCLGAYAGNVLSRQEILNNAWGIDYSGTSRTVDVHIRRIRNKTDLPTIIKTHRKIGYSVPR